MSSVPVVALSMLTLVPGGMGGSETYARELTRQLATTTAVDATAYVPATAAGFSGGIPESVIARVRGGASMSGRVRALTEATVFGASIRKEMSAARVVHYPFTVPAPRPARHQALVQSLLDVQHLDLPELFSAPERAYRRHFYEGAARKADLVITISEFAKQRMVDLLGISPDRIRVAPLGVESAQFSPNAADREDFILYPARGWRHKNHARLVEAMRAVRHERPDMKLVLTGGALGDLGELPEWVDCRGLVSVDELRDLYRRASALAFPSLYEGFGLPPLEAMASGCPVAASDSGSIPEVCGNAAVLFDPRDIDSIAHGILQALERANDLTSRGVAHARQFTWERCRDVHVEAYRQVA